MEELQKDLPSFIYGDERCGIQKHSFIDGWYTGWSPKNCDWNPEAPIEQWVTLAENIIFAMSQSSAGIKNLRCPFCGSNRISQTVERHEHPITTYSVGCGQCGATGPKREIRKESLTSWNTRKALTERS